MPDEERLAPARRLEVRVAARPVVSERPVDASVEPMPASELPLMSLQEPLACWLLCVLRLSSRACVRKLSSQRPFWERTLHFSSFYSPPVILLNPYFYLSFWISLLSSP
jgi:hypothetical protein